MTATENNQESFASRVRAAARKLGEFTPSELAWEVEVKDYEEKRAVSTFVYQAVQRGEIEKKPDQTGLNRVKPSQHGVVDTVEAEPARYWYAGIPAKKASNRQRLWNVARRVRGEFTQDDLAQLTGDISRAQIKKFCMFVVREGFAARVKRGLYRRTGEWPVDVPANKKDTLRMRKIRERKKQGAFDALDRALVAITEARMAIADLKEGPCKEDGQK